MPDLENHLTGPFYPTIGTVSTAPGSTLAITIGYIQGASNTITYAGTTTVSLQWASSYTFYHTITNAMANQTLNFYYFGSNGIPYWNYATHSGRVIVNVSALAVCSAGAQGTISGISVASTESPTPACTIQGPTAAANCVLYSRARTLAQVAAGTDTSWYTGLTPGTSTTVRGQTYQFEVVTGGFVAYPVTYQFTVPYLATDLTVGVETAEVVADNETGVWTQEVTGISGIHNNYRVYSGTTPLYEEDGHFLNTRVGQTTINNDKYSNAPEVEETITYTLWGGRTSASGGRGVTTISGEPGFQITNPPVTFTVTRAPGLHSEGDPADGTYFDNDLSTGAIHTVTLSSLTQNWEYNISASSANITTPLSTWNTATTKEVTDASATVPSGTNVTTTSYYLWRRDSEGNNLEYTGDTYNRSLANYDRFSFSDSTVTLADTDTEFTQTINNTIDGHTYYIYSGSSIVGTGIATGTTLAIECEEVGVPNPGDEVTHTLKTRSPVNSAPASAYSTGDTYTVTRTGTGSGSGEGADPSGYGLEVFNAAGTAKLYDTTSRGGRIMASGTVPASGTIAHGANQTVNVSGLANSTDYNVTVIPLHGGTGSGLLSYMGYIFDITKSSGSFTITNNSGIANAYYYYVIKSGGS